jgi:hypothetical protein
MCGGFLLASCVVWSTIRVSHKNGQMGVLREPLETPQKERLGGGLSTTRMQLEGSCCVSFFFFEPRSNAVLWGPYWNSLEFLFG